MRERNNIKHSDTTLQIITMLESLAEILLLAFIYYRIWRASYPAGLFPPLEHRGRFVLMGLYVLVLLIILAATKGLRFGYLKTADVVITQWVGICLTNLITYFQLSLIANGLVKIKPIIVLTLISFVVALICCIFFNYVYMALVKKKHLIMVYGNENALYLKFKTNTQLKKYKVDRTLSINEDYETIYAALHEYDGVIINDVPGNRRNHVLKYCYEHGIEVYLVPKITDIFVRGADDITMLDTPIICISGKGLSFGQRFAKRALDLVLVLLALIPCLPIMLVTAIAIKLDDHGPIFYIQNRVTRGGKLFKVYKFRSMIVDADKKGLRPMVDGDPRLTRVGRIIRRARIDELPQLFNILLGSMSMVGPRPEHVRHVRKYSKEIPEFKFREKVKGGLTGYAQIYGKYNTTAYDKLRLDLIYIENYSFLLDLKLIMQTVRVLFEPESTAGFNKLEDMEAWKEAELNSEDSTYLERVDD